MTNEVLGDIEIPMENEHLPLVPCHFYTTPSNQKGVVFWSIIRSTVHNSCESHEVGLWKTRENGKVTYERDQRHTETKIVDMETERNLLRGVRWPKRRGVRWHFSVFVDPNYNGWLTGRGTVRTFYQLSYDLILSDGGKEVQLRFRPCIKCEVPRGRPSLTSIESPSKQF